MRSRICAEITLMLGFMMSSTITAYNGRYDRECYKDVKKGLRLIASHVDKYVKAGSLQDCERACDIAFFSCKAFSYSDFHTREAENCLLSREDTHNLEIDDERDFYYDPDFTFYEKTSGRDCDYQEDHHHRAEVCYDLVKTRERINSRYVIQIFRTKDRRECEGRCTQDRECRGFNYRYKTLGYNQYRDNCELSSRDAGEFYDFQEDDDFDFYEQLTDSRRCRGSSSSSISSSSNYYGSSSTGGYYGGSSSGGGHHHGRDECFRLAKTETTMESRVIRESIEVRDIAECEQECTRSRYFTCKAFAFRYSQGYGRDRENCYLTDREYRELSLYDLTVDRSFDFYERRLYDRECGEGTINELITSSVTVSGAQCHSGSCREDREGGYFYCHTDFSDAWDYCCRPEEVCGFSQGYDMKWCYVGVVGRDQWRPCKDQGPGREYLKENHPDFSLISNDTIGGNNFTQIQLIDLNDIV